MEQISDFKLSTKLTAIYHDQIIQMDIIDQATPKKIVENFDLMKHFGQSCLVFGSFGSSSLHPSKSKCKMFVGSCKQWRRKLGLSKLRSERTFIKFSLQ